MTLGQWKGLQSKGYNALGAYQFIPGTLRHAAGELGLSDSTVMTPEVQSRLAVQLMVGSKRPRLAAYLKGQSNDLNAAADDLALEWASVSTRGGGTAYAGIGNNAASISRSSAQQMLQQARAAYLRRGSG
jgi:muramidase (phage lysozyme)